MRIALLGTRGVPASYSGFETCVEELGQRLVKRGHEVTAYCRTHHITYSDKYYKGMRLVKLPTITNKYLDTIVHTWLSSMHALTQGFDICLYFIAGNSPVSWMPRVTGAKTILNVDGLDWRREKWRYFAKKYIQFSEYLATKLPNAFLTDSHVVQANYSKRFGISPPYIPYGSEIEIVPPGDTLARFGLEPSKYVLFVGRLVPENCVHHLVSAFRQTETQLKCVIVGDAPYVESYKSCLRSLAGDDQRIIFTGYVFGKGYHELGSNAYIFVETSGVGGTHPALVEAMAFGNCVLVHNTPENLETVGDDGLAYNGRIGGDNLAGVLQDLLSKPDLVEQYRRKARQRASTYYSWERVTDAYERLFLKLLDRPIPGRLNKPSKISSQDLSG
jgi:glycosyltransferase involved in cell wall biosynthesis